MKNAEAHLLEALNADLGIVIEVPSPADVARYRQHLYNARKKDEAFSDLTITTSSTSPTELWIIKRSAVDGSRETTEGDA